MSHNFHIGQDVVCIKTHSNNKVKEGDVFTIKALKAGFCNCTKVLVHIGQFDKGIIERCPDCNITNKAVDDIRWFCASLFAPLDTLTDISEIEEILNQPIEELFK